MAEAGGCAAPAVVGEEEGRYKLGLVSLTHTQCLICTPLPRCRVVGLRSMQAILAAAMAAHTVLLSASSPAFVFPGFSSASPARPFHSAIVGQPLRPASSTAKLVATAAKAKPLVVVAAAKKAVAVLKGNSSVEGVVTLVQEDNGLLLLWLSVPLYPFLLGIFWGSMIVRLYILKGPALILIGS